ncbi:hypothetical protein [Streptomyces sp. NPDC050535]|uniref:hypothetical protein n=1 Tax=Streptomyces sp. NPDC050535 TaxID=3365626 RepID=UPI003793A265
MDQPVRLTVHVGLMPPNDGKIVVCRRANREERQVPLELQFSERATLRELAAGVLLEHIPGDPSQHYDGQWITLDSLTGLPSGSKPSSRTIETVKSSLHRVEKKINAQCGDTAAIFLSTDGNKASIPNNMRTNFGIITEYCSGAENANSYAKAIKLASTAEDFIAASMSLEYGSEEVKATKSFRPLGLNLYWKPKALLISLYMGDALSNPTRKVDNYRRLLQSAENWNTDFKWDGDELVHAALFFARMESSEYDHLAAFRDYRGRTIAAKDLRDINALKRRIFRETMSRFGRELHVYRSQPISEEFEYRSSMDRIKIYRSLLKDDGDHFLQIAMRYPNLGEISSACHDALKESMHRAGDGINSKLLVRSLAALEVLILARRNEVFRAILNDRAVSGRDENFLSLVRSVERNGLQSILSGEAARRYPNVAEEGTKVTHLLTGVRSSRNREIGGDDAKGIAS